MKRTLVTAALFAAVPFCYGQASSNGTAVPSVGVTSPTPGTGTVQQQPGTGVVTTTPGGAIPGNMTGTTGAAPLGQGGASVGQTIQSQPLPSTPSPNEPSTLGGTKLQPGVLGSAPPSQGVIGTPAPSAPCIGTVGQSGCQPTQ